MHAPSPTASGAAGPGGESLSRPASGSVALSSHLPGLASRFSSFTGDPRVEGPEGGEEEGVPGCWLVIEAQGPSLPEPMSKTLSLGAAVSPDNMFFDPRAVELYHRCGAALPPSPFHTRTVLVAEMR